MTNETKIKVPKKYHGIVESIQLSHVWRGKYLVTFSPSAGVRELFYSNSQADVLEYIRLVYAVMQASVPAPVPEEPAAKEELTNVDANDTAIPVEQDHVPSAVAVDAPEIAPDQKATTPMVDDQRIKYLVYRSWNNNGYFVVSLFRVVPPYGIKINPCSAYFPDYESALDYARDLLDSLGESAAFRDHVPPECQPP